MFPFAKKTKSRVFVGLSGGVDSGVSAALLKREGYDVTGVFIRIEIQGYPCPAREDRIEAMRVAAHLNIPFIEIDCSDAYQKRVFAFAMQEFERGRTPNPDALCNREIKFGIFFDFARQRGADYIATGHYARVEKNDELYAGADHEKDQSYFLWAVPKEHLAHTLFPVGGMKKHRVRALAKKFRLPNALRPDSQGLCFLGDISLEDMLAREIAPKEGAVLSEGGDVVGTHKGVAHYTLGQRHGFTLIAGQEGSPHFVIAKDNVRNTITVSKHRFPQSTAHTIIVLDEVNRIGDMSDGEYEARFRYRQTLIPARLETRDGQTEVTLLTPHYVPEGQSLVLYRGSRCAGGGIIRTTKLV